MNLNSVSIVSLLIFCFCTITTSSDNPTLSSSEASINCGSIGTFAARNGREWHGDGSKFYSLVKIKGSSTTSYVTNQKLISDPIPYKTARISRSQFSYKLQINPGQKILRFHFSAAPYKGFKQYKDWFDVEAGPFTLLSNFSASLVAHSLGVNSFVKEFCVNIEENQLLNIVFSPATSQFRDTYAFINGLEVVSVPVSRSYFHVEDVGVQLVGKSPVYIDSSTALEIVRKFNTKHDLVLLSTDNNGDGFLVRGTVPEQGGNKANNITWKIPVDVGFRYVVRIHFSRLGFKIAEIGGFMFEVLINGMVARTNSETFKERDEDGIDWYRDYVVLMKGRKQVGRRNLLISLLSNDEFLDGHGPLKGFEILKLSNSDNSLASPNPLLSMNPTFYQNLPKVLSLKNVIVNGAILLLVLLNIILYKLWVIQEAGRIEEENMPSVKEGRHCRQFSLAEIKLATNDFSRANRIGRGGFGKVYKGTIDNGQETVAIKRLKLNSSQGEREFLTEIETLMEVRHVNVVSLIGYCNECKEMVLVYEYMASGSLADHLFKLVRDDEDISSLTWKQRLNICLGAGRGLDYLHTGVSILHRDVKASNILLDEDFTAKVADFGLAKPLSRSQRQQSHVSTKVKGTFGYLDPEYVVTGKLTRHSDTYAFGVVLLEVLCGRRAIDREYLEEEQILTKWALVSISKGETERIVDSNLKDEISDISLKAFVSVVERCLHNDPKKRPTMAEVVLQLQFVLEMKESSTDTFSDNKSDFKDIHLLNDETQSSSSSAKLEKASEEENLLMPPVMVQFDDRVPASEDENTRKPLLNDQFDNTVANSEPPSRRKNQRKIAMPKISRLWRWGAFRKKDVPSSTNELLSSGISSESVSSNSMPSNQTVDITLHDSLHGWKGVIGPESGPVLSWSKRVKIAVGAAKGLAYLHEKDHVHTHFNSSDILIFNDAKVVKITDFHLPRSMLDEGDYHPYPADGFFRRFTAYLDDDYDDDAEQRAAKMAAAKRAAKRSDVYNFGVVLLELLTGRKVIDAAAPLGQRILVQWAKPYLSEDKVKQCVDARLNGKYRQKEAAKMAVVAALCLDVFLLPDMNIIVKDLETL